MTSSSEMASHHQAVPEDDRSMPEPHSDPGGATSVGNPESSAPAEFRHPGVTAAGSAAGEPGTTARADSEEPFTFSRAPVAEPEPASPEPPGADRASTGTRWAEIQATCVDNPRAAVQLAASLVSDTADALVVSLREQQHSLLCTWEGNDAGTEELRTTIQQYHTLWNRLEDFSRQA